MLGTSSGFHAETINLLESGVFDCFDHFFDLINKTAVFCLPVPPLITVDVTKITVFLSKGIIC